MGVGVGVGVGDAVGVAVAAEVGVGVAPMLALRDGAALADAGAAEVPVVAAGGGVDGGGVDGAGVDPQPATTRSPTRPNQPFPDTMILLKVRRHRS